MYYLFRIIASNVELNKNILCATMFLYRIVNIINPFKFIAISDIISFYCMIQTDKRTDLYGKTDFKYISSI